LPPRRHGAHQVTGCHIAERLVVHQADEDVFVAVHALDEQVLELLVEHGLGGLMSPRVQGPRGGQ